MGLGIRNLLGFSVPELSSGRTKKKLSERPMRSLMVACEIAQTGSPCTKMEMEATDSFFFFLPEVSLGTGHDDDSV